LTVERRFPEGAPIRMIRTRQPPGHYPDPPFAEVTLQIFTVGQPRGWLDLGLGRRRVELPSGSLVLAPAHTACDYEVEAPLEMLILNISSPWLGSVLALSWPGFDGGDFGSLHEGGFENSLIASLAEALWQEAELDDPPARLFIETTTLTLASALLRASGRKPAKTIPGCGNSRRLRRALDMIDARLADDLSLDELSGAAALSPRHFLRVFQQEIGLAPYAYLQQRRVERAREMLARTDMPLVAVALACGFKSQSHFGQVFRRVTSKTPGAYRRERQQ